MKVVHLVWSAMLNEDNFFPRIITKHLYSLSIDALEFCLQRWTGLLKTDHFPYRKTSAKCLCQCDSKVWKLS